MNHMLVNLLTDKDAIHTLQAGLPFAFEVAEVEAGRVQLDRKTGLARSTVGQEVGIYRERILQGFLISQLGQFHVRLPEPGVPMVDVSVAGWPLEIKSASRGGLVTAKWTADTESANKVLEEFQFESDLLVVRVWWGQEKDSIFYTPVEVLREKAEDYGKSYLSSATNTNNRGVKVLKPFMDQVEAHPGTTRVSVNWQPSGLQIQAPIVRHVTYWLARPINYWTEGRASLEHSLLSQSSESEDIGQAMPLSDYSAPLI